MAFYFLSPSQKSLDVPLPWEAQVSSGFLVSLSNETRKSVLSFWGQSIVLGTQNQGRKLVGFCLQSLFVAPASAGHLRYAWSGWALTGSSVAGFKQLGSSVPHVSIFLLGPVDLPILVLPRLMAEPQEGRQKCVRSHKAYAQNRLLSIYCWPIQVTWPSPKSRS